MARKKKSENATIFSAKNTDFKKLGKSDNPYGSKAGDPTTVRRGKGRK